MAGNTAKGINEYTDDELAGLSSEELAALRGDKGGEEEEEEEETEEERAEREAAEARAKAGDLDPDAVARLAAEGEGEQGSRMVPHSRFEEVNAERRLLLEEVIRLRNGGAAAAPAAAPAPAPPPYDFKGKRKEYHALLLEDPEKAADLLEEIEIERDKLTEQRIREAEERGVERATATFNQQRTRDTAETTAARLYEKYPFLNNESDKADEVAIYAVIGRRDALINGGMNPIEAMQKAAEEVGEKFAKLHAPTAAPAPAAADAGTARRAEELRRSAEASGKQPPTLDGGIGNRATDGKLDINNLTDEQLMKLSPEELAKLRGDTRLPA